MTTARTILVALALAGCSTSHAPDLPYATRSAPYRAFDPPPLAPAPGAAGLDGCLEDGGELALLGSVDNNDVHDHGALLTFGISPTGLLAAAGADGTLKLWTLEAELLAVADGSALTYGSETGAVPITDLAFDEEAVIAGDVRGLVQAFDAEGRFDVLGGTTPDVPIVAVAFDPGTRRLAHAQRGDVVPLVVRGPEGSIEIADTLDDPRDLAFGLDGTLMVAGGSAGAAAIELRDAVDPARVVALVRPGGAHLGPDAAVREIAAAREGDLAVAASAAGLAVIADRAIALEIAIEGGAASVDLGPSGALAWSVGSDGTLRAHATSDGREVARAPVASGLVVRVDATGQRVIVGSSDAMLHVFGCLAE